MTIKTRLLTIAAAVAVTAGIAGASIPASAAPISPLAPAGVNVQIDLGGIFRVRYGYNRAYCRRLLWAARHGNFRARILYRRYCTGRHVSRYRCRRWYILGYRYGNPLARRLYRRYCRYYGWYR
jgi:hypothetical protein